MGQWIAVHQTMDWVIIINCTVLVQLKSARGKGFCSGTKILLNFTFIIFGGIIYLQFSFRNGKNKETVIFKRVACNQPAY